MRERGGVGHVVDGDDLEIGATLEGRAQHAPSDAAEAIDADTSRHAVPLRRGAAHARTACPADHPWLSAPPSVALRSSAVAWGVVAIGITAGIGALGGTVF